MKTKLLLAILCAMLTCYAINSNAQANTTLSNLTSPTAINQNLLPTNDNKKDLGSNNKSWRNIYLDGSLFLKGIIALHSPGSQNFFIGSNAGNTSLTGSFNTGLGQNALTQLTSGYFNTATGYQSLFANTTGSSNTATGHQSLLSNTTGSYNTASGESALIANTTGYNNTANGFQSLYVNSTGFSNTANGFQSLYGNTSGSSNVAIGSYALYSNTIGFNNTAIGDQSMYSNIDGVANTGNGAHALHNNTTGSNNTADGVVALYYNRDGSNNTANGVSALENNTTGSNNTANGVSALSVNKFGSNNTALGCNANVSYNDLTNATAIGYNALVDASNKVHIGNGTVTSIGGYVGWTTFPSDQRFKNNVQENVAGLAFIKSLRPITYTVNVKGLNEYYNKGRKQVTDNLNEEAKAEMKKAEETAGKIVHNGFIAQEVEEAAKKLNYEFSGVDKPQSKDGVYGLRYGDFVVPLVKAVQELNDSLQSVNSKQQQEILSLQSRLDKLEAVVLKATSSQDVELGVAAKLEQNIPNPFSNSTTIPYYLPANKSNAYINFYASNGVLLKSVHITDTGKGTLNVKANELPSGVYQYALVVDGKVVDKKQMIQAK